MLYIYLFGYLRVFHGKQPLEMSVRPKTVALWASLLLGRKKPIPRDSLAFLLWPDAPESAARADLRRHLHELERALPAPPEAQPWLLRQGDNIQWNPESAHWLDVAEFERLGTLPDYQEKAASLYTNDLLLDVYEDSLDQERSRLRALYFDMIHQLVAYCQRAGDLGKARAFAEEALRRDPLDEPLIRELMSLYYMVGDRGHALKAYESFQQRLLDDLQIDPGQDTIALYDAIVAEQPLPEVLGSAAGTVEAKHNILAALTSFFGREDELVSLHEMLTNRTSAVRQITLIGPPGTGKTRLALEVARRLLARQTGTFPDGIYFVDLSAIPDQRLVMPTIAATLEIKESPEQPIVERVRDHLKSRYMLLILDNFEHVIDAAVEVANLLAAAPGLCVLVTSRESLKLYSEHEFMVAPLPYPEPEQLPEADAMLDFAAVALFDARARQRQMQFSVTDGNKDEVASICAYLDGLPLPVELAAAQIRDVSLSEIHSQLQAKRISLSSNLRDLPPRHQTLQAAISWSYDLLAEQEKRLFRQLSVFAGDWALEAAEAVCDPAELEAMADRLQLLEDKNLIQRLGTDLWRMLVTIREFASARLNETSEAPTIRKRHLDYFTDFATAAHNEWFGPKKPVLLQSVIAVDSNLQAALSNVLEQNYRLDQAGFSEQILLATRLILSLADYWRIQGQLNRWRNWLHLLLEHMELLPIEWQLRVYNSLGAESQAKGDPAAAKRWFSESVPLAKQVGDPLHLSISLCNVGVAAIGLGDLEEGRAYYLEALTYMDQIDDENARDDMLTHARGNLGWILTNMGDYPAALTILEDNAAHARKIADPERIATGLQLVGGLHVTMGNHEKALPYFHEAMQKLYEIHPAGTILCDLFCDLAGVYTNIHQDERGSRLFGFGEAMRQKIGYSHGERFQKEIDDNLATLTQCLGSEKMSLLLDQGAAMTIEEAVSYALQAS